MKSWLLLPFLIYFSFSLFAQGRVVLEGRVIDKTSRLPLPYVNLSIKGKSIGSSSNEGGTFVFAIPSSFLEDTLLVTSMGYKAQWLLVSELTKEFKTIALEQEVLQLEEVVVLGQSPLDLVCEAISKVVLNYQFTPYQTGGFNRNFITSSGHYQQLSEALFEVYHSPKQKQLKLLSGRYIEDKKLKEKHYNVSFSTPTSQMVDMKIPAQGTFLGVKLSGKNKKSLERYYDFTFKATSSLNGKGVYVISFNQKSGVKKPLLQGKLFIDKDTKAFVKIEYDLSEKGLAFLKPNFAYTGMRIWQGSSFIHMYMHKDRMVMDYRELHGKWYLSAFEHEMAFNLENHAKGYEGTSIPLHYSSQTIVTSIERAPRGPFADSLIVKNSSFQNHLKNEYEAFSEGFWQENTYLKADTSYSTIALQIKHNNEQWEKQQAEKIKEKTAATPRIYQPKELKEDLSYLESTLQSVHPGLYWYREEALWKEQLGKLRQAIDKPMTEQTFFYKLSPLIESIHCGHTGLLYSKGEEEKLKRADKFFPLQLRLLGEKAFIWDRENTSFSKGDELLSINGVKIDKVLTSLKAHIPSDGYNTTLKEFLLEKNFAYLYRLYIEEVALFRLEVLTRKESKRLVVVLPGSSLHKVQESEKKELSFHIDSSLHIGILRLPSFISDRFPQFLAHAFGELKKKAVDKLIIDIRDNGGGYDPYSILLYSYLSDKPFMFYKQLSVATTDKSMLNRLYFNDLPLLEAVPDYLSNVIKTDSILEYKHPYGGIREPSANHFKGKVYVLINGGSYSGAAEFASIAYASKRATFIGEESGGAYRGNCSYGTPILTLPHTGIRVAIPLVKVMMAVGSEIPLGKGVLPDYPVSYSLEEVLEGIDKEMQQAIKLIRKETSK